MNFASSHAYLHADDAAEEVAEDDLSVPLAAAAQQKQQGAAPMDLYAPPPQAPPQAPQLNNLADFRQSLSNERQRKADVPVSASSTSSSSGGFFSSLFGRSSAPAGPPPPPAPSALPISSAKPMPSSILPPPIMPVENKNANIHMPFKPKKVYRRQADTNVVAIKFDSLAKSADDLFAGDPVFCTGCMASLSKTSKITKPEGKEAEDNGEMVWVCEFCHHENKVNVAPEEIPAGDTRDYILEPASEQKNEQDEGMVVFAIDVSGSMCVTTQVPGKFKLKGVDPAQFDIPAELRGDYAQQIQQRNAQASTWVSRLQCVQAAVSQQIEDWNKTAPNKRVGLVTFNREVTVIGDATGEVEIVTGDKLKNQQALLDIGAKHEVNTPISKSSASLSKKLLSLEESGPTALGPAMLVSIAMASKKRGSRVVLCTDGLANVGLGSLDKLDEQQREAAEKWYNDVGEYAKQHGVTVSVISIKGDECALEDLGRVAEHTGGDVLRVDPQELTHNFKQILAQQVIATQVTATFFIHQGLTFRNEEEGSHRLIKEVGNVTEESEVTFEYQIKSKEDLAKFKDLKALPFQVQIRYSKLDGMKCLRVISKEQPITNKREEAEQNMQVDLLAAAAAQKAASLAQKGQVEEARAHNIAWARYMGRNASHASQQQQVQAYVDNMSELDNVLQEEQVALERNEAESDARGGGRKERSKAAREVRSDAHYSVMHKAKNINSKAFK